MKHRADILAKPCKRSKCITLSVNLLAGKTFSRPLSSQTTKANCGVKGSNIISIKRETKRWNADNFINYYKCTCLKYPQAFCIQSVPGCCSGHGCKGQPCAVSTGYSGESNPDNILSGDAGPRHITTSRATLTDIRPKVNPQGQQDGERHSMINLSTEILNGKSNWKNPLNVRLPNFTLQKQSYPFSISPHLRLHPRFRLLQR